MMHAKHLMMIGTMVALFPLVSCAAPGRIEGYLLDTPGNVVRSGTGLCWHTGTWTVALAIAECDPDLIPKPRVAEVHVPAPVPAPAPQPVVPPVVEVVAPHYVSPPVNPPVVAPKKVVPKKFSFSSDMLFDFDKHQLRPKGMLALDGLLNDLQTVNYDSITVVGHTDRIGTNKYNQKLSEKRAKAVRDYLESKNIPASKISAQGMGESQPLTQRKDCTGQSGKKLIACLQPDRRVDVDVAGLVQP